MMKLFQPSFWLVCLFFISPLWISGQSRTLQHQVDLQWTPLVRMDTLTGISTTTLYFSGAVTHPEAGSLPVYRFTLPENVKEGSLHCSITPLISREIPSVNVSSSQHIASDYQIFHSVARASGSSLVWIEILPLRTHPVSGQLEALDRFTLHLQWESETQAATPLLKNNPVQSVLASGDWYKLRLEAHGVYRLTYTDLQNMGLNINSIDPRKIRIHGNGGGALPENNATPRYDDLREMAIYIQGEDDGRFDPSDYILFYAQGPDPWVFNAAENRFENKKNPYSDYAWCFLTHGQDNGLRISPMPVPEAPVTRQISTFTDYAHNEKDLSNLIKSGRQWFGESFDLQTAFDFNYSVPNLVEGSRIRIKSSVAARSLSLSYMRLLLAGSPVLVQSIDPVPPSSLESEYAKRSVDTTSFKPAGKDFKLTYQYTKPSASAEAWLDYFTLNYQRHLVFSGPQMGFRKPSALGSQEVAQYNLAASNPNITVWDITDPTRPGKIQTEPAANGLSFLSKADLLREFITFDGSSFLTPVAAGKVSNQNLHGMSQADYIIIAHPDFLSVASEIATIHRERNNLITEVVTPEMVYNEFSSGAQDPTAIRDFMRYLRNVSGNNTKPAHLLLVGDASYDYKDRISANTNFVPTYQSAEALNPVYSFATDDYFGLLDDTEGNNSAGVMDLCVGRLPFFNVEQAVQYLNKFRHYLSTAQETYGDWRSLLCFVADDEDSNTHLRQADQMAEFIDETYPQFNIDKIYMDAYQQVSTPGGQRYPDATQAINQRIESGVLIMNYTGHGGELGWAHERVLEISDINSWTNINRMPLFITATCEFSRYDDPQRTAAGEWVFLNPNGGSIAMFTTARLTFGGSNLTLNRSFFKYAFQKHNDRYRTLGEIILLAKQESGSDLNGKKFILLGDPALTLAYPSNKVNALSINGVSVDIDPDTLNALSHITVTGEIAYPGGYRYNQFQGTLVSTVFDKTSVILTKGNDAGSKPTEFNLRKNIVYKGQSKVENGLFSFSFIVPKDIEYRIGQGKMSFYAYSASDDAAGYFNRIMVGGINPEALADDTPPVIQLFMNDTGFRDGDITDENPSLLAMISDSSGINTVGNGIGHDLMAILDQDTRNPHILNDFYKSDLGTFRSGSLLYPFYNLTEGPHEIKLTAWDIHNNSASAVIRFTVVNSARPQISDFYNYPNPFSDRTWFVFGHNQPGEQSVAEIRIFDLTGRLIRTLTTNLPPDGYRSEPIEWDGTSDAGARIGKGMYICHLILTGASGNIAVKSTRLIITGIQNP